MLGNSFTHGDVNNFCRTIIPSKPQFNWAGIGTVLFFSTFFEGHHISHSTDSICMISFHQSCIDYGMLIPAGVYYSTPVDCMSVLCDSF